MASLTGIVTIVGGAVSIVLNSALFARWGYGFLSVANTTDILLSGVMLATNIVFSMWWIVGFAGCIFADRLNYIILTVPIRVYWVRLGVAFLVGAVFGLVPILLNYGIETFFDTSTSLLPIDLVSGISGGLVLTGLALWRATFLTSWLGNRRLIFGAIVIGSGIFVQAWATIEQASDTPLEEGLFLLTPNVMCEFPRVVWLGSTSLIAGCENVNDIGERRHSRTTYMLLNRDQVRIGEFRAAGDEFRDRYATLFRNVPRRPTSLVPIDFATSDGVAQFIDFVDADTVRRTRNAVQATIFRFHARPSLNYSKEFSGVSVEVFDISRQCMSFNAQKILSYYIVNDAVWISMYLGPSFIYQDIAPLFRRHLCDRAVSGNARLSFEAAKRMATRATARDLRRFSVAVEE